MLPRSPTAATWPRSARSSGLTPPTPGSPLVHRRSGHSRQRTGCQHAEPHHRQRHPASMDRGRRSAVPSPGQRPHHRPLRRADTPHRPTRATVSGLPASYATPLMSAPAPATPPSVCTYSSASESAYGPATPQRCPSRSSHTIELESWFRCADHVLHQSATVMG